MSKIIVHFYFTGFTHEFYRGPPQLSAFKVQRIVTTFGGFIHDIFCDDAEFVVAGVELRVFPFYFADDRVRCVGAGGEDGVCCGIGIGEKADGIDAAAVPYPFHVKDEVFVEGEFVFCQLDIGVEGVFEEFAGVDRYRRCRRELGPGQCAGRKRRIL